MRKILGTALLALALVACAESVEVSVILEDEPEFEIEHGHADNNGVKIHYATAGEGPLVVMIHGFPDYWYTWRHQMEGLYDQFQVVAIDTRGYNLSDAPDEESAYAMPNLIADVAAVINHFGHESATVVGHDWGGVIAWQTAFNRPDLVDRLIILNLPHPNGWIASWESDPEIKATTDYARVMATGTVDQPDVFFGYPMTPQTLSGWVRDEEAKAKYVEAFERSDFEAMLSYYRQNYPRNWEDDFQAPPPVPPIEVSTLMFHGLEDIALHSDGLNNNWDYIDADLTLVTVPGASHFVQQDAAELVTSTMRWWLLQRTAD